MNFLKKLFGSAPNVKLSQADYNRFFNVNDINGVPLAFLDLGDLNVPTGQIVACDPLVSLGSEQAFTKKVPPGKYPVKICVAKTPDAGDRYAFAKLIFNDQTANRWEMALVGDQKVKDLKEDDGYFGFPVDAGLACFCDGATQQLYDKWSEEFHKTNPGCNVYDDHFEAEFKKNATKQDDPADIGDWLNFDIPGHPGHNVIMFQSGYGDGLYPSYWGYAESGDICCLIIDFLMFE